MRLAGKIGIVTAAASGMGRAGALRFAREGAQVADVQGNSPAAQAGLKAGDVIIALNGRPVRSAAELRARLSVVPVGEAG